MRSQLKKIGVGVVVMGMPVVLFFVSAKGLPTASAATLFSFFSKGDKTVSAYGVSRSNSQTEPLMRAATNIDPNPSRGGGDITVVDDSALESESGPVGTRVNIQEKTPTSDQISVYVVREGDSLSQIAEMFNVSVNTIKWANGISASKSIHAGQTLLILPISGVQYTVKKGDTLASIAKQYGGDVDEIIHYNGLANAQAIEVGKTITIPGGEAAAVKPVPTASPKTTAPSKGSTPSPSVVAKGYFINPNPGSTKTQGIHGYNGVDLASSYGSPILAAASGEVIVSREGGWNGGYGNYIVISHPNGSQTLYGHLSQNLVAVGAHVKQGQVIGYEGSTGRSTGPHLHFEVRGAKNPMGP